jgi:two-component system CheB/CheR fusion protein
MISLTREAVDLALVARHAAESISPRIEQYGHTLTLALSATPVLVDGDAGRLEQVVTNLLENAAKYTEPGGRITLSLAEKGDEAMLSVRDTGIGLDPDRVRNIFDLFTQVDNSLARERGGLGLGLSVVQRILDLHGGRIEARSSGLGQGSEFLVWLPLYRRAAPLPAIAAGETSTLTAAVPRARRLLIVDDNADSAHALELLARAWGHEVAVASDGRHALELAESFKPEFALVDIGLPGMDGYEVARRLREDASYRTPYLVALTGYGGDKDRADAREAGFDEHWIKPGNLELLELLLAREDI